MATKKKRRRPPPTRAASNGETDGRAAPAPPRGGAAPERRERKQMAREARERARKQARRRAALRRTVRAIVFAAVIVAVAGVVLNLGRSKSPTTGPTFASGTPAPQKGLPGLLDGNQPWPSNVADFQARLQQINLAATVGHEGGTQHIHQHLDIYINGQHIVIPTGIGVSTDGATFSPIHTHTSDGIIHVESDSNTILTLGEFFDVWGVKFGGGCIGGYCAGSGTTLNVYVNGHLVPADQDPSQVELTSHEEIAIVYGTASQAPSPVPSSYTFPVGV